MNETNTRLSIRVDVDLKAEIKKQAAIKNITMSHYVLRAVYKQIRKDKAYEKVRSD